MSMITLAKRLDAPRTMNLQRAWYLARARETINVSKIRPLEKELRQNSGLASIA